MRCARFQLLGVRLSMHSFHCSFVYMYIYILYITQQEMLNWRPSPKQIPNMWKTTFRLHVMAADEAALLGRRTVVVTVGLNLACAWETVSTFRGYT